MSSVWVILLLAIFIGVACYSIDDRRQKTLTEEEKYQEWIDSQW